MATLVELNAIESNSRLDAQPGEPPEVTQARELRMKVRGAAMKIARTILVDTASLPPEDEDGIRTRALERIAWARQTIQNPDGTTDQLLRLALAGVGSGAAVSTILSASDTVIENGITPLVPLLAKGLQVTR